MGFAFDDREIALPKGAWARTHRRYLRHRGRLVLGLTQGEHRAYVFPLFTPKGHLVTSEAPADHPHHQSVWIGADHVHALVPASEGRVEEYTYNFYINEVFQGRAPGHIVERDSTFEERDGAAIVRQVVDWRGPVEWGAPDGRVILQEARTLAVVVTPDATAIRIRSVLRCAQWPVRLGPTRHAYVNARVSEALTVTAGGRVLDDGGRAVTGTQTPVAEWIDYVGAVGGGSEAGVALMPLTDRADGWWFVADWGVVTWGPFRRHARALEPGAEVAVEACIVAHDGDVGAARLRALRDDLAARHID